MFSVYKNKKLFEKVWKILQKVEKKDYWIFLSKIATIECVQENLDKNWNWFRLSKNPNMTFEIIENNPHLPWDYRSISNRKDLDLNFVGKNLDKGWNWYCLTCNKNVTWEFIQNHPDWAWVKTWISSNPNITLEIIKNNPNIEWNWTILSKNLNIPFSYILNHLSKKWDWYVLSKRKDLKWEIVENHKHLDWKWEFISKHPCVTEEIFQKNIENKKWVYKYILKNPNFKEYKKKMYSQIWEDLKRNNTEIIHRHGILYRDVVKNLPIVWEDVQEERFKWLFPNLHVNPNITLDIMMENPDNNWDWYDNSPNITLEDLEKYPSVRVYWERVKLDEIFDLQIAKEYIAILKIKKWWRNL